MISVGSTEIAGVYVGGTPAQAVYLGSQQVWSAVPPFVRQKINKAGRQVLPSGATTQLTGWTSDSTYPAVVASNGLLVAGSGPATIHLSVSTNTRPLLYYATLSLRRNGTEVGSIQNTDLTVTGSWTADLTDGDILTLVCDVPSQLSNWNQRTITAASIDIVPT